MTVHRLARLEEPSTKRLPPTDLADPAPPDALIVDLGDTVVDDATGATVLAVGGLPEGEVAELRRMLPGLPFERPVGARSNGRASGLRYQYRTFGFSPRMTIRRKDACSSSLLAELRPDAAAELDRVTLLVADAFAAIAPGAHARQAGIVDAVLPEWRVAGSLWTSGIINNTAALPYHRDRNNFAGSWSAMLCVRSGYRGGLLHVPGYGVHVACSDTSVVFFDGSVWRHAVTPLVARSRDAYRFTLVWYAQELMRRCLPCAEEIARAQRQRAEREAVAPQQPEVMS